MVNNSDGNDMAIRDYLRPAFSRVKDAIISSLGKLQQPAPIFPHKPFSVAIALILGFLQVTSQGKGSRADPLFDSSPALYYTAVAVFLIYCLAGGFEIVSSSHPVYPIPEAAINVLRRCMFLAGSLTFAATAAFLFPDSIRAVMFASIFAIIATIYIMCCGYHYYYIHDVAIV